MNKHTNRFLSLFLLTAAVASFGGPARAGGPLPNSEGSLQLGDLGLQRSTVLQVVIVGAAERLRWQGAGILRVLDDAGTVIVELDSGDQSAALNVGTYTLQLTEDQAPGSDWGVRVENPSQDIARLRSTRWNFDTGSFVQADAVDVSFFVEAQDDQGAALIEARFDGLQGNDFSVLANSEGLGGALSGRSALKAGRVPPKAEFPLLLRAPSGLPATGAVTLTGATAAVSGGCDTLVPGDSVATLTAESTGRGVARVVCDDDGDGVFDPADGDSTFAAAVATGEPATFALTGLDAAGNALALDTLSCRVTVARFEVHVLLDDVESAVEGLRLLGADDQAMFFDDAALAALDEPLPDGTAALLASPVDGLPAGLAAAAAEANVNARAWGRYNDRGRGDDAFLDTWTPVDRSIESFVVDVPLASGTADADDDGIPDGREVCTTGTDPENRDTDSDGLDDGDEDLDQDGTLDFGETDPNDEDTDDDGVLDGRDIGTDADNDGAEDGADNCPGLANASQADFDSDGVGDDCDDDVDGDGYRDDLQGGGGGLIGSCAQGPALLSPLLLGLLALRRRRR